MVFQPGITVSRSIQIYYLICHSQIFDGFLDFDDQIMYSSCGWRTFSELPSYPRVIRYPWHNVVYIRFIAQTSRPAKAFYYSMSWGKFRVSC